MASYSFTKIPFYVKLHAVRRSSKCPLQLPQFPYHHPVKPVFSFVYGRTTSTAFMLFLLGHFSVQRFLPHIMAGMGREGESGWRNGGKGKWWKCAEYEGTLGQMCHFIHFLRAKLVFQLIDIHHFVFLPNLIILCEK